MKRMLLVALVVCLTANVQISRAGEGDSVLATIAGSGKITVADLKRDTEYLPEELRAKAATPEGRKKMLDSLIVRQMVLLDAVKMGLDRTPEVQKQLDDFKMRIVVDRYLQATIVAGTTVTPADLTKYYETNKSTFVASDKYRASHILVKTEPEAKGIIAKLKSGVTFEELAKKESVDSTAEAGGDLGWFEASAMVAPFSDAVVALKDGEISGVVTTEFGFHVIKRTDHRSGAQLPFEEVREEIEKMITSEKQQEAYNQIKANLKKQYKTVIDENVLEGLGKPKE